MKPLTLLVLSNPTARVLALLDELPEETQIAVGNSPEAFEELAPEADIILNRYQPPALMEQVLRMAPNVKWVHSQSAGVNNSLCEELCKHPIPLTNGRGVFSRSLAEFAIGAMLFFAKRFRQLIRQQQEGVWETVFNVQEINGLTMGIVGYGSIGQAVARLAKPMGMRVIATRRNPEAPVDVRADLVLPVEQTAELIAESDYVVVTLPEAPGTRKFVDASLIAAMKPAAVLISIGRGTVIDEEALIEALNTNRIAGAALDVFETEPLPDGHPFFGMENVLLSPHCADHTPGWEHGSMRVFLENFTRFQKGEPLVNQIDKEKGY